MNIKKILIAGTYEEELKKQMLQPMAQEFRFLPVDEITEEHLDWADAYVGFAPPANLDLLKIKWVHSFNAGVNNFLEIKGWEEKQVLLTRTVCSFGQRIAEYCLSYVLQDLQNHQDFKQKQLEKKWEKITPKMLRDQTIVVFGTGEIGQEVARTFEFFGATVYGVSQSRAQKLHFKEVVDTDSAAGILPKADWVISTLPLTAKTSRMFNQEFFSKMSGSFINVGRGATVDEEALIQSLDRGNLRSAVLDVLATEPLPGDSSLWARDDVTITPHISAVTELDEAIHCFLETLQKVENGAHLSNRVDVSKGY